MTCVAHPGNLNYLVVQTKLSITSFIANRHTKPHHRPTTIVSRTTGLANGHLAHNGLKSRTSNTSHRFIGTYR
jgi:hypothetical protein